MRIISKCSEIINLFDMFLTNMFSSNRIRLRAMVDLEAGEQLLHSYTYTLDGTAQRQSHLKSGKYFTCKCRRCLDPSELGINFSTLKCSKCSPDGWLRPLDPLGKSNAKRNSRYISYIGFAHFQIQTLTGSVRIVRLRYHIQQFKS